MVVKDREIDVRRGALTDLLKLSVYGIGNLDGIPIGLLEHVHQDCGPAVGGHDVVDRALPRDDVGQVRDEDRRSLDHVYDRIFDLRPLAHEARHRCQVQAVVLLHHSRGGTHVAVADCIDDLRQGHPVAVEPLGIDKNVVLRLAAADNACLGHAGQTVESRRNVVVGQLPEVRGGPSGRCNAETDHREHGKRQPVDVETGRGGKRRRDLRDPALNEMQRVQNVHIPPKEHADLGRAATGDGPDRRDARNDPDRLLDRPCHGQHLQVDGSDPVVDQDHDPGKIGLREDSDRQLEDE